MGVIDRLFGLDKLVTAKVDERTTKMADEIASHLAKASVGAVAPLKLGTKRYSFDAVTQNNNILSRKKPDSGVAFDVLRKFSVNHEISRAAINYRKRQIQALDWDIVSADSSMSTINEKAQTDLRVWFKQLGGSSNKYRKFVNRLIEDLLVLDAVALEKQMTVGGDLYTLVPIDATTIRLWVDDTGGTPEPPDIAYKQVIRGQITAEYTTDEMIYEMMNPRSNTPYGLAPLESLLVIVSSSLKAGLYNLAYLTEGNIPEGFFGVPKEWTPQMIKDFQENWDAVMAGDETATAKLRFAPDGAYQPTKKPNDMAWEQFNDWLMKITCALFDVQPTEIGFHPNKGGLGGAGHAQAGADTSDQKGLFPLAKFLEEVFTEIIQVDLGYPDLAFGFQGLESKDEKLEADTNQALLFSGQRTINEIRTDEGLDKDPSPQADKLMIVSGGAPTFLESQEEIDAKQQMAADIANGKGAQPEDEVSDQSPDGGRSEPSDTPIDQPDAQKIADHHVQLVSELRTFRKYAINKIKAGKTIRPFTSDVLPEEAISELNKRLEEADIDQAREIFREYMQDYQIDFLADVYDLRQKLKEVI